VVVVMGVAGCGKTSVGQRLARCMAGGSQFIDADDHHPPSNIAKMRSGQPLSDADRMPWLQRLSTTTTSSSIASNSNAVVLACSCLRKIYRDTLRSGIVCDVLRFVFLAVPRDVALLRVASRAGHFMPAALVHSQFATLEVPAGNDEEADVVAVDASLPIDALC
ncbi:P-loop containing nucleoside triphosphate hydrolase protein, partial [Entophlyctis helioformis]